MNTPQTISAVIITYNEERNIARCLKSLTNIADEVIVVDSFSTDQTKSICNNFNVKFIEKEWKGYSATKNYANSLSNGDYILSLDADEALSDKLKEQLLIVKHKGFSSDAYSFNRLTNYCGTFILHCGWYPDKKLRLWKKDLGQWKGLIHEDVVLKGANRITHINSDILHYSYYTINEHLSQMMKFTDLMAEDIVANNKKVSLLKLTFSPLVKFVKSYLIQGGYRDGFNGFIICILSGVATFLKYAKARQLQTESNRFPSK